MQFHLDPRDFEELGFSTVKPETVAPAAPKMKTCLCSALLPLFSLFANSSARPWHPFAAATNACIERAEAARLVAEEACGGRSYPHIESLVPLRLVPQPSNRHAVQDAVVLKKPAVVRQGTLTVRRRRGSNGERAVVAVPVLEGQEPESVAAWYCEDPDGADAADPAADATAGTATNDCSSAFRRLSDDRATQPILDQRSLDDSIVSSYRRVSVNAAGIQSLRSEMTSSSSRVAEHYSLCNGRSMPGHGHDARAYLPRCRGRNASHTAAINAKAAALVCNGLRGVLVSESACAADINRRVIPQYARWQQRMVKSARRRLTFPPRPPLGSHAHPRSHKPQPTKNKNTRKRWQFIVARCKENLSWLNDLLCRSIPADRVGYVEIVIVSKCADAGNDADDDLGLPGVSMRHQTHTDLQVPCFDHMPFQVHFELASAENFGFETSVYLSMMAKARRQLRQQSADEDTTGSRRRFDTLFFLQGDPFDHTNTPEQKHNFFELVRTLPLQKESEHFGQLSDSYVLHSGDEHYYGDVFCQVHNALVAKFEASGAATNSPMEHRGGGGGTCSNTRTCSSTSTRVVSFRRGGEGNTNKLLKEEDRDSPAAAVSTAVATPTAPTCPAGNSCPPLFGSFMMSLFYVSTERLASRSPEWYELAWSLLDAKQAARHLANVGGPDSVWAAKTARSQNANRPAGWGHAKLMSTIFERLWHVLFLEDPVLDPFQTRRLRKQAAPTLWPSLPRYGWAPEPFFSEESGEEYHDYYNFIRRLAANDPDTAAIGLARLSFVPAEGVKYEDFDFSIAREYAVDGKPLETTKMCILWAVYVGFGDAVREGMNIARRRGRAGVK